MSYCQYEYTHRASGEPPNLLHEIHCLWCDRVIWIEKGDLPRDWCSKRPDTRPYSKCIHRKEQIDRMPNKLCGNCKGLKEAVFICEIHDRCTMHPIQHNQTMKHCLGCFQDQEGFEPCLSEIQTQ